MLRKDRLHPGAARSRPAAKTPSPWHPVSQAPMQRSDPPGSQNPVPTGAGSFRPRDPRDSSPQAAPSPHSPRFHGRRRKMLPSRDRVLTKRRLIDISAAPPDFRSRQASSQTAPARFLVYRTGWRPSENASSRSTARAKTVVKTSHHGSSDGQQKFSGHRSGLRQSKRKDQLIFVNDEVCPEYWKPLGSKIAPIKNFIIVVDLRQRFR